MKSDFGIDKKELKQATVNALKTWKKNSSPSEDYLDTLLQMKEKYQESPLDNKLAKRLKINEFLLEMIDALRLQNGEQAELLLDRFIKGKLVREIAHSKNESVDFINRLQRKAIEALIDLIYEKECQIRQVTAERIEAFLPASQYTKLFGFEEAEVVVKQHLLDAARSWVVAIVGLGGMGKTALADKVARQLIQTFLFEDVLWFRVESSMSNQKTPKITYDSLLTDIAYRLWPDLAPSLGRSQIKVQVRRALKERPYLIVIDNLEAATDAAYLLDELNELSDPSKFLITTRVKPSHQSRMYGYPLKELTFDQATALLRYHADELGLEMMQEADKDDMDAIYKVTGGNPLALRLVVSLLDTYTLPRILENLRRSTPGDVEDMYQRIFWQAWHAISDNAKRLLKVMPLVSETGATPEFLQGASMMTENEIWPLISELKSRSLIESRGNLSERRFSIHQVTATFLKTEIVNWDDKAWQP